MNKLRYTKLFAEIHERIDAIESHFIWLIRADQRFHKGQRIQFSRRVIKRGSVPKTRTAVKGKVLSVSTFSVRVQMDDRKHPQTYHHGFLNPVSGAKLF